MSSESDPTVPAIQNLMSTFGVEGFPASGPQQERLIGYDDVNRLAGFLESQGCYVLAELPQGVSQAEHMHLRRAQQAVEKYIRTSGDHRAAALSRSAHYFEVAAAATPDDARALLDKYDDLHPYEDPEKRKERKQGLMNRWADVQVLRQHAQEDSALAPEVAGPECQLPPGFKVKVVEHNIVAVDYSSLDEVLPDLTHYRDTVLVDPPAHATAGGPGEIQYDDFHTFAARNGNIILTSDNLYQPFGVPIMERFAHVTDRTPEHASSFDIGFQCPMPPTTGHGDHARSETLPVPVASVLETLAHVTGLPQIAQARPSESGLVYDLPGGGSIQITGSDFDHENNTVRAPQERYTHEFRPPYLKVNVQLGMDTPNEELGQAAKRLSAWMTLQTAQAGHNPGLPQF